MCIQKQNRPLYLLHLYFEVVFGEYDLNYWLQELEQLNRILSCMYCHMIVFLLTLYICLSRNEQFSPPHTYMGYLSQHNNRSNTTTTANSRFTLSPSNKVEGYVDDGGRGSTKATMTFHSRVQMM